jgi:hypothetical protein
MEKAALPPLPPAREEAERLASPDSWKEPEPSQSAT